MTRKLRMQIAWVAIIAALLGGAYLIVARNGATSEMEALSGYVH